MPAAGTLACPTGQALLARARSREVQSIISFTPNSPPAAAKLTSSGGLFSAMREYAVKPSDAQNTMLLRIENFRDFFRPGTELTHLGTLSPQL